MNYTELISEIASYTENAFDTADMNTFITQAEQRIYNSVQLPSSRKTYTMVTATNNNVVALPADYLAAYSLALVDPATGNLEYLLNKDPNFVQSAFPVGEYTGAPTHYAQISPYEIVVGPVPDAVYGLQLVYFGYPESITTTSTGRTWLGDNFDSVLLYGSLVEAYTFMKGEQDMMAVYDAKFKEALAMLKQLVDAKVRQDSYRTGQVRYPVT